MSKVVSATGVIASMILASLLEVERDKQVVQNSESLTDFKPDLDEWDIRIGKYTLSHPEPKKFVLSWRTDSLTHDMKYKILSGDSRFSAYRDMNPDDPKSVADAVAYYLLYGG